jgi:hypothetical protein
MGDSNAYGDYFRFSSNINETVVGSGVGSGGGVESLIQRTLRLRSSISASALEKSVLLGPINKKPLSGKLMGWLLRLLAEFSLIET